MRRRGNTPQNIPKKNNKTIIKNIKKEIKKIYENLILIRFIHYMKLR